MKKVLLLALTLLSVFAYCQDKNKPETKMQEFSSKSGVIIRLINYPLDKMKTQYGQAVDCKIRKIIRGSSDAEYYYCLEYNYDIYSSTAAIEYSDLIEVNKAIKQLRVSEAQDISSQTYLENYFQTSDGFKIGYYVDAGKINWYIRLEKYGSHNTAFIKGNSQDVENSFTTAQAKIEELRK